MAARIFRRSKNAMQSGRARTDEWVLEFESHAARRPDPLMGWSGGADTQSQVLLTFETLEQARDYAERNAVAYQAAFMAAAPDYFERTRLHRAYVSEHYRTAIILTAEDAGIYLDKFAVLDEAQGEGLGRAVWQVMREQVPRLFWRSRRGNPVNAFYFAECDGCLKQPRWKVFWYGYDALSEIAGCIEHCEARPTTLEEPA